MTDIKIEEYTARFDFEPDPELDYDKMQHKYLLIKPGSHYMDFLIMEKDANGGPADELIHGFLKWDGYMNWSTDKTCMYHYCDIEDAEVLYKCFQKLYELGEKYIEAWNP